MSALGVIPLSEHARAEFLRLRAQIQHARHVQAEPTDVPFFPNWTPIAKLTRLALPNRWEHIEGAPLLLTDATRLRDRGLLLMGNRHEGAATLIVVKTPTHPRRP